MTHYRGYGRKTTKVGLDQLGPTYAGVGYDTDVWLTAKKNEGRKKTILEKAKASTTHRRVKITLPKIKF